MIVAFPTSFYASRINHVKFHGLRLTLATWRLLRGAISKGVSEALGHSSTAFTTDTYSHIIEGVQSDAMVLPDEILNEGNGDYQTISDKLVTKIDIATLHN